MIVRGVVLVVALVAVVAGCSTPKDPPSPSTSTSSRPSAQQGPRDRDKDAVLAALRRIDLCEVLDAAVTTTPGLPAGTKPQARQPFECVVDGVSAKMVSLVHSTRLSLPIQAIGGTKAYVRADGCQVHLPVSFELAIEFRQAIGPCQNVTKLAAASVTVLADGKTARVDPRWDACTVFAEAVNPDDLSKVSGNGLIDCTDFSSGLGISFADDLIPPGQPRTETIGGKQLQIFEDDRSCDVYWRQGPFTSRLASAPDYQVHGIASDCDRATTLAESVMAVLAKPPPSAGDVQQPLFYAPDQPDSPLLGACAYAYAVLRPGTCESYRAAPVPDDIAKSFNAQAMCAVAVDAVRKHFGAGLLPVAVTDSGVNDCYFVEPARSIQLTFVVHAGPVSRETGDQEVTIGGHPGYVAGAYSYELSTSRTTDAQTSVRLSVGPGPVLAAGTPLPTGTDKKAEAVLTDVLQKYFA